MEPTAYSTVSSFPRRFLGKQQDHLKFQPSFNTSKLFVNFSASHNLAFIKKKTCHFSTVRLDFDQFSFISKTPFTPSIEMKGFKVAAGV